ncbi:MAG: hypothetical protein DRJ64_03930 [Thermoprotei archaeon]|nr:MAG: hypothetical protein DRJ64_03930 [Thermoprotei archaeon]
MPTATREETKFIQKVIILIIVPLIVCIFIGIRLSSKNENVKEQIRDIQRNISRYLKRKDVMPTMRRVKKEQVRLDEMKEHFETVRKFATVQPIAPPEDVVEKGVYFKKRLYLAHKRIKKMAANLEVDIPETIGFGEALPADKDVPLLLRKLETIDTVLTIILNKNVESIMVIKILDDRNYTDDKGNEIPVIEISLRIDINCTKQSLVDILYAIGALKPFIVVKDISVKNLKEGILEASLILSRLIVET